VLRENVINIIRWNYRCKKKK